jgi:uncharacterized protein YpmS
MICDILAFWAVGPFEFLIILAIPVILIILVVIFVTRGSKEREKLHQKMAELTDELKQTQEQLQKQKKGDSSTKSG